MKGTQKETTLLSETTISGYWKESESVRYILFEDFKNGNVIGFIQHNGVTKSTITGNRDTNGRRELVERVRGAQQLAYYKAALFPNEQRIELRNTNDPVYMTPYRLQLLSRRIPTPLFEELEHLKSVENYEGHRFMNLKKPLGRL